MFMTNKYETKKENPEAEAIMLPWNSPYTETSNNKIRPTILLASSGTRSY